MREITDALLDAWSHVQQLLRRDPAERDFRIARRVKAALLRPPRAWCLTLRANDARLTATPIPADMQTEHFLDLNAAELRKLCAPVYLVAPGQRTQEVARMLGTTPLGLRNARVKGIFQVHHVKLLDGSRGRPVPLLYTRRPLNPCAKDFAVADPIWGLAGGDVDQRIPDDLLATLTRVPVFRTHVSKQRYADNRHPELDAVAPRRILKHLPPPAPDYVWYKWSLPADGRPGYFLGDDSSNWRKGPADRGERPPLWRTKKATRRKPQPSRSKGSLHFNGWRWRCPACGKLCRTIFLPLPPEPLLARHSRLAKRIVQRFTPPRPISGFACERCHRVKQFSRVAHDAWNDIVTYLSGGLLYGHEVQRPPEFTREACAAARIVPHKPRPNAKPSMRREQVATLLVEGLTYAQIAERIGVKPVTIVSYARRVYMYHNVQGRAALARKLGHPDPRPTMRSQIKQLLEEGWTNRAIAERFGLTRKTVYDHAFCIQRSTAKAQRSGAKAQAAHDPPVDTRPSLAPSRASRH